MHRPIFSPLVNILGGLHQNPGLTGRDAKKIFFTTTVKSRRFFLDDTYTYYLVPERLWPVHTQEVVVIELKMVVSG